MLVRDGKQQRDPRRLAAPNGVPQVKREVRVSMQIGGQREAGAGNSPGMAGWRSCGGVGGGPRLGHLGLRRGSTQSPYQASAMASFTQEATRYSGGGGVRRIDARAGGR